MAATAAVDLGGRPGLAGAASSSSARPSVLAWRRAPRRRRAWRPRRRRRSGRRRGTAPSARRMRGTDSRARRSPAAARSRRRGCGNTASAAASRSAGSGRRRAGGRPERAPRSATRTRLFTRTGSAPGGAGLPGRDDAGAVRALRAACRRPGRAAPAPRAGRRARRGRSTARPCWLKVPARPATAGVERVLPLLRRAAAGRARASSSRTARTRFAMRFGERPPSTAPPVGVLRDEGRPVLRGNRGGRL
jgi:hypothetical protein